MASSWGDERSSFRFGTTEMWLDIDEFDAMVDETRRLVEKLEEMSPMPASLGPMPSVLPAPA